MDEEERLNEAEKAAELKAKGAMAEKVDQALGVCGEWVRDESGEFKKDCWRCCYWDEADLATMVCGERLMQDARKVIQQQKARIDELEDRVRKLSKELARVSQREWNA